MEAMGSSTSTTNLDIPAPPVAVLKRKRTKRKRVMPFSPPTAPTSSNMSSEEEEDMANCLILLAQGHPQEEKFVSRRFTEAATTTAGRAGFYVYECKTCNKCFSSFQALGGHRASHKRPKMGAIINEDSVQISLNMKPIPFITPTPIQSINKIRVHECSVCGSEFSSGQALGGHMRRHRPAVAAEAQESKKERPSFLSLDLNLPAPSDDHLALTLYDPAMVFSSTMVDCHY